MMESTDIVVACSQPLTEEDRLLLTEGISPWGRLVLAEGSVAVLDFTDLSDSRVGVPGWQYALGLDLSTVLSVALASLPALFAKKLVEEAAKDFWLSLKRLLTKVSRRDKALPLASVQIRLPLERRGMQVETVLTYLNCARVSDEVWLARVRQCLGELDTRLALSRALETGDPPESLGRRIIAHAIVDGSGQPRWYVLVQPPEGPSAQKG